MTRRPLPPGSFFPTFPGSNNFITLRPIVKTMRSHYKAFLWKKWNSWNFRYGKALGEKNSFLGKNISASLGKFSSSSWPKGPFSFLCPHFEKSLQKFLVQLLDFPENVRRG